MYHKFSHINTMSMESPYGFRTINLYYGAICDSQDELLVISSHANPKLPPSGAVIFAIEQKYKISFDDLRPLVVLRGVFGTHWVDDPAIGDKSPHKRILVLRIPGAQTILDQGLVLEDFYNEAIWSVFGSLAALELKDYRFSTMSLPLLGGTREYPILETMGIFLKQATRWLQTSRFMHTVNFYLIEEQYINAWTNAMDIVLGRRLVDKAHNHVARALSEELLSTINRSFNVQNDKFKNIVEPIVNALRSEPLCLQMIAAFGRTLVERLVQMICSQHSLAWKGSLLGDIETLRKANIVAPWMISHFHSLRILGNETVHVKDDITYKPESLKDEDLIPILVSLLRITSFWKEWQ